MTKPEILDHSNKVAAARIEFAALWTALPNPTSLEYWIRVEQIAWLFFLHGKGLK